MTLEWSDEGVAGAHRFLRRFWKLVADHVNQGPAPRVNLGELPAGLKDLRRQVHQTLAKVTDDIGRRRTFNTAIAAVMELSNALAKAEGDSEAARVVRQEAFELIALMLAPIAPHLCHVLWRELGHADAVIDARWPQPDPAALQQDSLEIVVQVNGKLRARIAVPADASDEETARYALADANVRRFVEGKELKKKIVVRGKLVNLVVAG
jgi:leucyl-tRNA synthetase